MRFFKFPFLSTEVYFNCLRIFLGFLMIMHGLARIYYKTLTGFGDFLESKGLIGGIYLASAVTAFDILGGSFLMKGIWKKWICLGFIGVLTLGIFLVHLPNGWFVVGHQLGGVEYSLLLILCFLLTASDKK